MGAPRRIPESVRAAILDDWVAGRGGSLRALANKHGVSSSTVKKITDGAKARDSAVQDARERAQARTAEARSSRIEQMAALRQDLALKLIEDAHALRQRAQSPMDYVGAFGNVYRTPLPAPRDQRDLYVSMATAVGKHIELVKLDHDPHAGVKSLIEDLVGALKTAWEGD